MTVSDLRETLKNFPDDMPVAVEVGDEIRIAFDYEEKSPYWGSPGPKAPVLVIRG
ncbi:hypothetical protein LCGC14_1018540 [marine sediment metagenome]|uniref:Uncharacterized protein n=1 Tax=marine sediment metagenome TaxID=412755 RepID=A0A0F9NJR4_9ZZZZ